MGEDRNASLESSAPRKLSRLRKVGDATVADGGPALVKNVGSPCIDNAEGDSDQNGSSAGQPATALESGTQALTTEVDVVDVVACVDGEARESSPAEDLEVNDSAEYWDEEDELQQQLEVSQQGEDPGMEISNASARSVDDDEEDGQSEGEDFGSDALLAETQRILRETAKRDCLGKGFQITIKPISSVLSKLKEKRNNLIARPPPLQVSHTGSRTTRQLPQSNPNIDIAEIAASVAIDDDELLIVASDNDDLPGPDKGHFEAAPVEDAACSDGDDDDESASSASEEEYEDSSDSGSSSEDEADLPSADPASGSLTEAKTKLAQANAIEEARQLLRDNKDAKNVSYLEDEAEMSEDGGHSDEDESDEEDGDSVLNDLIGHETEGRHDEKIRSRVHAEWAAKQEEQQIKGLMEGLKNGFKRKRRAGLWDEDEGTNRDARWRRALLAAADEDDDAAPHDSNFEHGRETDGPALLVSDDEDREELNYFKQQKALKDSQAMEEEDELLDEGHKVILNLLQRSGSESLPRSQKPQKSRALQNNAQALDSKVSFLGRVSSSALGDGTKLVSQLGATRSFVFGKENSHLGISRDLDPPQGDGNDSSQPVEGATTFAGLGLMVASHASGPCETRDLGRSRSTSFVDKRPSKLIHAVLRASMSQKMDGVSDGPANLDKETCLKDALKRDKPSIFGVPL